MRIYASYKTTTKPVFYLRRVISMPNRTYIVSDSFKSKGSQVLPCNWEYINIK